MTFRANIAEILFVMRHVGGLDAGLANGVYNDLADGAAEVLLEQAARFAEGVLAPLNRVGDLTPPKLQDAVVTTSPGWKEAYRQWVDGGWNAVTGGADYGGMALPHLMNAGCTELWNSANMAFALCPLLGFGACDAVEAHASPALKETYLHKMISGEWTATMNLTEPSAGSDLAGMRTRAERGENGQYRIFGSKIFITYGEHDMTDNIVHLVLARLPDAPAGTRGISLFLVPKFLVNPDGSLGARNDVHCSGLEHKLGIHGSPTCVMTYGDRKGAIGWLVGEENRGLACMFTMMNNARLAVGLQGVAMGERATQAALAYARERKQGRSADATGPGPQPIIHHMDVKRMVMTMRATTDAARAICYATAGAFDQAERLTDPEAKAKAGARNALLTPLAKAFSSDIGVEAASLGVQVHGGMGFIEETGAAQFYRDSRIAPIYEGANGIQAIDLVMRKLPLGGGATIRAEIADMESVVDRLRANSDKAFTVMADPLEGAIKAFARASEAILKALGEDSETALAGATPYLRLFGLARGGAFLAELAMAAKSAAGDGASADERLAVAQFFAANLAPAAGGLEYAVIHGAQSLREARFLLA